MMRRGLLSEDQFGGFASGREPQVGAGAGASVGTDVRRAGLARFVWG